MPIWGGSYGFPHRGLLGCYLVTVIFVVWFVYLKNYLLWATGKFWVHNIVDASEFLDLKELVQTEVQ